MKQSNTHQKFSKMINSNVQKRKCLSLWLHEQCNKVWWETTWKSFYSNIQDEHISDEVQTFSKCMEYIQSQYYGWISWSVFEVWYSFAWWCLKISERPVYSITNVIHVIILHLQDSIGMQFLKWLTLNWNLRQTLTLIVMRKACAVVSHIFNPHVRANNKYMNSHNAEEPSKYIACGCQSSVWMGNESTSSN